MSLNLPPTSLFLYVFDVIVVCVDDSVWMCVDVVVRGFFVRVCNIGVFEGYFDDVEFDGLLALVVVV